MWKVLCLSIALVPLIAGAKVGKLLAPISDDLSEPLPIFGSYYINKYAKIAREIVHNANETMLATLSVQKPIKGYPMVDTIKVADSTLNGTSTGNVNFYLQKNDPIFANIKKKNEVSAFFSNETTQFNNETSQFETIGNRVMIAGFVSQIPFNTTLGNETTAALIDRHPDAIPVLGRLNTVLVRLEIEQVCVIDDINGPFCLTPDDYYNADVDE